MANLKNTIRNKVAFDFMPKQAFIAFVAADYDLIRLLATGEKACMMSMGAVRQVQQRKDLMQKKRMSQLSLSLYNERGTRWEHTSHSFGTQYAGDLRRYNHILELTVKGCGKTPNGQEQYADIMDFFDSEVDPILMKLRYTIANECLHKNLQDSNLIAELTLAHCMCYIAATVCDLYKKRCNGNEYVLCADPSDKTLHVTNPLFAGYRVYPVRSTDYNKWAKTLDEMVGELVPSGLNLRNNENIDYGLEGVVKRLQSIDITSKAAQTAGLNPFWAESDPAEHPLNEGLVWVRYKPPFS